MTKRGPHWTVYVGTGALLLGLAWQIASGWFAVQHRLDLLERRDRFVHGTFTVPKE